MCTCYYDEDRLPDYVGGVLRLGERRGIRMMGYRPALTVFGMMDEDQAAKGAK